MRLRFCAAAPDALDINTNPPFVSMINPQFIKQMDLLTGVLPSRYSYATGGVVDIETKDGCDRPGGTISFYGGQRETAQPSAQYGGCVGKFGYYVSGLYSQSDTAFSSATPGPDPIHDHARQGQLFGVFSYALDENTKLGLILSAAASNNQLPNVPGLAPEFTLTGAAPRDSSTINSDLDFRDYLAILSLRGAISSSLTISSCPSTPTSWPSIRTRITSASCLKPTPPYLTTRRRG